MHEKYRMTSREKKDIPRYHLKVNAKTTITVNQDMLFTRTRWLLHFGSFAAIEKFIDEYNKEDGRSNSRELTNYRGH